MRNVVIDLGNLDYIYSDTINVFISSNRHMLEVSGRIAILAQHPKVQEILRRAGLDNIMRIYRSEAEMIADSKEILRQTSSYRIEELQKIGNRPERVPLIPKTEFDEFRDEMGAQLSEKIDTDSPSSEDRPQVPYQAVPPAPPILAPKPNSYAYSPPPAPNYNPNQNVPVNPGYGNQPPFSPPSGLSPGQAGNFDFPTQQIPVTPNQGQGPGLGDQTQNFPFRSDLPEPRNIPDSRRRTPANERLASPSARTGQFYTGKQGIGRDDEIPQGYPAGQVPSSGQPQSGFGPGGPNTPGSGVPGGFDSQATVQMPPFRDPESTRSNARSRPDINEGPSGFVPPQAPREIPSGQVPGSSKQATPAGLVYMQPEGSHLSNTGSFDTVKAGALVEERSSFTSVLITLVLLTVILGGGAYYYFSMYLPSLEKNPLVSENTPTLQTETPPILAPSIDSSQQMSEVTETEVSPAENNASTSSKPSANTRSEKKPEPKPVSKPTPDPRPTPTPAPKPTPKPASAASQGAVLAINTTPTGAEVLINYAKKGSTPLSVELQGEKNRILIKLDGYEKYETTVYKSKAPPSLDVTLKPEASTETSTPSAASPTGDEYKVVNITSTPAGAEVLLNYSKKGVTPMDLPIYNNTKRVMLRLSGYKKFETTILKSSAPPTLAVTLESEAPPAPASKPEPPAEKPAPPPEKPAPPVVKAPEPEEEKFTPGTGADGKIFLSSSPARADILVDGKLTGKLTPTKMDLPSGSHKIEMRKDGMKSEVIHTINPGVNKALHMSLQ